MNAKTTRMAEDEGVPFGGYTTTAEFTRAMEEELNPEVVAPKTVQERCRMFLFELLKPLTLTIIIMFMGFFISNVLFGVYFAMRNDLERGMLLLFYVFLPFWTASLARPYVWLVPTPWCCLKMSTPRRQPKTLRDFCEFAFYIMPYYMVVWCTFLCECSEYLWLSSYLTPQLFIPMQIIIFFALQFLPQKLLEDAPPKNIAQFAALMDHAWAEARGQQTKSTVVTPTDHWPFSAVTYPPVFHLPTSPSLLLTIFLSDTYQPLALCYNATI